MGKYGILSITPHHTDKLHTLEYQVNESLGLIGIDHKSPEGKGSNSHCEKS
jgi:hypothetical protein